MDATTRLLTLTGPGGCGKTRLAIAGAEQAAPSFAGGVVFVDLAATVEADIVIDSIARALGLREIGTLPSHEAIQARLLNQRVLILLDNFEHLMAAAIDVSRLLQACPSATFLVTSRAPLRLQLEREFAVRPLGIAPLDEDSVQQIALAPAAQLYVERVQARLADFSLTAANAASIAQICARLDGLPLAIELAAARIHVLPPASIVGRLDRSLDVLQTRTQDIPSRHQALRSTIAWSEGLLTPTEQLVFRRLAIFPGEMGLDAAASVCRLEPATDILSNVEALVEQSLLEPVAPSINHEPRFRLLATIREYAMERLCGCSEEVEIAQRHARYFAEFAELNADHFWSSRQVQWLEMVERDLANFRKALNWSVSEEGDPLVGLRIASALWRFWDLRGYLREGRGWLTMLLARVPAVRTLTRARALIELDLLSFMQGDPDFDTVRSAEAAAICRGLGDMGGLAIAVGGLCSASVQRGNLEEAAEWGREGLRIAEGAPDALGAWAPTLVAALVFMRQGDLEAAGCAINLGMGIARQQGDLFGIAYVMVGEARLAFEEGRVIERALVGEAVAALRDLRDPWLLSELLEALGAAEAAFGAAARASRLLGAAERQREAIGTLVSFSEWHAGHDHAVLAANRALGRKRSHREFTIGRSFSFDQACVLAIGDVSRQEQRM
jgi:non-specific serine/threonine protein kinase